MTQEQEPRYTQDLINELDTEAPKFTHVMLAVAFEHRTIFVTAGDANRLQLLNDAVKAGGDPVGFIGLKADDEGASFYRRSQREYAGERCFSQYFSCITDEVAEMLGLEKHKSTQEWVN